MTEHAESIALITPDGARSFESTSREGGGFEVDASGHKTRFAARWEFDLDLAPAECTTLRVGVRTGLRPRVLD